MVIPVIEELQRTCDVEIQVLALTTAGPQLRSQGRSCLGFADFVDPARDEQALQWGRELAASNANALVPVNESVAYLGLSFADLVTEHGLERARQMLQERGRGAFLPVSTLQRVLERLRPDVVIATNSPRAEQAAILAARQVCIPALCMVDLFAVEEIKYVGQPGYADRICVLNEDVRDRFLRHGRQPGEILVTGNPAFDALAKPEHAMAGSRLRQQLGGDKVILWPSQPEPLRHRITGAPGDPALPRRLQAELEAVARRHEDWRLLVRPHPSEDPGRFPVAPPAVLSPPSQPLAHVLHAADAVVCLNSTVGYEAALLGKPLVHLPMSVYWEEADYSGMGLGLVVRQLEDLELALNSVLSGRWTPPVRLQLPGGAAGAVAAAIMELAGRNASSAVREVLP